MKITALYRNDAGQIIAEVLGCGKTVRCSVWNMKDLVETIFQSTRFTTREEIREDLEMNYADFEAEEKDDEHDQFRNDVEADHDALKSAGFGDDEDYEHNLCDEGGE